MAVKFDELGDGQFQLNVCGYSCPHPQMYTKKALQKMSDGDVLTLIFDNPSSGESIMAMCENEGNELFDREDKDGSFIWKIRKG
ncbi:MAG: sulfurtransferase TusA family protein [Gammaproteobacteria bacterium]|nr:sulfurtransferase TusA family protein [Gammaproteobacteria bacterium]